VFPFPEGRIPYVGYTLGVSFVAGPDRQLSPPPVFPFVDQNHSQPAPEALVTVVGERRQFSDQRGENVLNEMVGKS
jgi:hypothetical protein